MQEEPLIWHIDLAKAEDLPQLIEIQKLTALEKFPNEKSDVTKTDIQRINEQIDKSMPFIALSLEKIPQANRALKALTDNRVLGFILLGKGETQNKISALYVLPDFEGRGIGTDLILKGLDWLGNEKPIFLETISYREDAICFYKKFGFVEIGTVQIPGTELENGKFLPEIGMLKTN